jgi:hypothetical protein
LRRNWNRVRWNGLLADGAIDRTCSGNISSSTNKVNCRRSFSAIPGTHTVENCRLLVLPSGACTFLPEVQVRRSPPPSPYDQHMEK